MTRSITALLERRRKLLGSAYSLFYSEPVHLVRGEGVWLFDAYGKRYLDMYNNVPHVGHCHPHVVETVHRQLRTLNTHTRYVHETILELADRLTRKLPKPIDTAMFCCTGSEANELALRIARAATGGEGIIATDFAYHGNTRATYEITTCECPDEQRPAHVVSVPVPDAYRGKFCGPDAATRYAAEVATAMQTLLDRGIKPAAMIIDPTISSGGVVKPVPGYLSEAAKIVQQAGALFITDEIQSGLGRTGTHFWAFEADGVRPDIVTLGKPMGNGYPVAAMLARSELVETFAGQAEYFNTFGGNPVSCAAGLAVLEVIERQNLQENARTVGGYIVEQLFKMKRVHRRIGDVRGTGLFIALEIIKKRGRRLADPDAARQLVELLKENNVLTGVIGPERNILKLRSPLVLARGDADFLLQRLDASLCKL